MNLNGCAAVQCTPSACTCFGFRHACCFWLTKCWGPFRLLWRICGEERAIILSPCDASKSCVKLSQTMPDTDGAREHLPWQLDQRLSKNNAYRFSVTICVSLSVQATQRIQKISSWTVDSQVRHKILPNFLGDSHKICRQHTDRAPHVLMHSC